MSAFYLAMPIGSGDGDHARAGHRRASTAGTWRSSSSARPACSRRSSMLLLPEPVRGASEGVDAERLQAHEQAGATAAKITST